MMASTSSLGSNEEDSPPPIDTIIVLTSEHCRALISTDPKRVCGLLKSQCARAGHKSSEISRGEPGAYTSLGPQRRDSPAPDGDYSDYVPLDEWEEGEARRSTRQAAENAAMGDLPAVRQPFLRSPYASAKTEGTEDDDDDGIPPSLKAQTTGFVHKASVGLQRLMRSPKGVKGVNPGGVNPGSPNAKRLEQAKRAEADLARQLEEAEREAERAERERAAAQTIAAAAAQQEEAEQGRQADLIERNIEQIMKTALAALEAQKAALRATPAVPPVGLLGLAPPTAPAPVLVPPSGQETSGRRLQVRGGQDPNHDDDLIYGVPKVMEAAVFAQLIPTELDARTKGELETLLPDVVAPTLGTFGSTSESAQDDVTSGLLNALEFHNNVDIPSRGGFVKKDASWNTTGRVGLYKVKTQSDFARLMYGYQIRERDFQERFSGRVRAVLIHFGYSDADAANFAESSRYVLICVRAHFLYGRLLAHLEKEIDRTSFKLVKPVIDLFAVELVGFRDDISRLSMWLSTYVYLRRLVRDNFWSRERQEIVNRALLDGVRTDSGGHDSGHPEPGLCAHCGGHPPGHCPFKAAGIAKGVSKRLGKQTVAAGGRFQTSAKKVIDEYLDNETDAPAEDEGKEKKEPP